MFSSKFGCPSDLFNVYMEVGEIKISDINDKDCRFIELWVGSCYKKNYKRPELQQVTRRLIIDILDDVLKLADGKTASVMIMEDDDREAVHSWYQAIYLVIKYLKQVENIKAAVPFTRYTADEISELNKRDYIYDFFADTKETFYDIADAYVTGQPNIYYPSPERKVFINRKECWDYLGGIVDLKE